MAGPNSLQSGYSPAAKYAAAGLCTTAVLGCGFALWYRRRLALGSPSLGVKALKSKSSWAKTSAVGEDLLLRPLG